MFKFTYCNNFIFIQFCLDMKVVVIFDNLLIRVDAQQITVRGRGKRCHEVDSKKLVQQESRHTPLLTELTG